MILVAIAAISCKKEEGCQPEVITNNIHDTVTVTNTDTVYMSPHGLVGLWKVYKSVTITNGSTTSSSNTVWLFNFTSSQLEQDLDANGSYEYTYNATYGSNYVDIYMTATPTTYVVTSVGSEYRMTRQISSTQSQVWYLKK